MTMARALGRTMGDLLGAGVDIVIGRLVLGGGLSGFYCTT